jgi:PAS domain S-box-containing protein
MHERTPSEDGSSFEAQEVIEAIRVVLEASSRGFMYLVAVRDQAGEVLDLHYRFRNAAAASYGRQSDESMYGRRLLEAVPGLAAHPIWHRVMHVLSTGEPAREEFSGMDELAERRFVVSFARAGDGVTLLFDEVSEGRAEERARDRLLDEERAARALAEEQKGILDLVIQQSGDGIVMADAEGVLRVFNPAAERQHGMSKQEVSAPEWAQTYGLMRPDGRPLPLDETPLYRAVHGATSHDVRWLVRRPDGAIRTLIGTATPLRRADGTLAGGVLVSRDETERVAAEEERERLLLALAKTNAELDQFAYVVSHDLKAPLRGIRHLSEWIDEEAAPNATPSLKENLVLLRERVQRLEALIDGILAYARLGRIEGQTEEVDLRELLQETVELLAPAEGAVRSPQPLPVVRTERVPLQQVLINLIGNALTHGGGAVRVRVAVARGGFQLSVEDDGPGIPASHHERIWALFATLGPRLGAGASSGIGLATVKRIVEGRGGRAWLVSAEGEGATFHVWWPVTSPRA